MTCCSTPGNTGDKEQAAGRPRARDSRAVDGEDRKEATDAKQLRCDWLRRSRKSAIIDGVSFAVT